MNAEEFARAAYPLLHEGIVLLRAHAGEGPAIERYVATVEKVRAQYRAANALVGTCKHGCRTNECETSCDDKCVAQHQESESTCCVPWQSCEKHPRSPAPAPDVYDGPVTAGMRFEYKGSVFVPDGRRGSKGEFLSAQGDALSEPNLRGMYRPIPAPAPESSAPPSGVPVCSPGCGKVFGRDVQYCHEACCDAGRPLNPPPSDPVTVASGGVPTGYRLGAGWVVDRTYLCSCTGCRHTSTEYYKPRSCGKGACAAHAVRMGALVPIDTPRPIPPVPAHPATGTTCTRCGQVIQSVLPAFPPVATVDGWRHERCPDVPPGPVPVEACAALCPRPCSQVCSLPRGHVGRHAHGATDFVSGHSFLTETESTTPAAPASEPAPTCSVPCLSRTCPRICELDHGHPPDRDHSHASRPNESGHTWSASEPAVRLSLWERMSKHRPGAPPPSVFKGFCDEAWTLEVEKVPRLEAELAATARDYQVARDAHDRRHDDYNDARAEVAQLRGKLAEGKRIVGLFLERSTEFGSGPLRNDARAWSRFDTGTATAPGGEVTTLCEHGSDGNCRRCYMAEKSAQADAIKAAPHVCRCSNGPCPKCGGTGPEGEWFEGSEVECADCGAPLIVATAEPCHGSSTFEAIDEEPDEEDDESGEDAPGTVTPAKGTP